MDNQVFLDRLSLPIQPFNWRYQFAALPSRDNLSVNILSFAEIEQKMNTPEASGFGSYEPLVHEDLVRRVALTPNAPVVVTSTRTKIFVWSAFTGQRMGELETKTGDFVILDHMNAIAFTQDDNRLALYSYATNEIIATFEKPSDRSIAAMVDSWQLGVAYVTDNAGHVFEVVEHFEDGRAVYAVSDTGIVLGAGEQHRTILRGGDGQYYLITLAEQAKPDTLIRKDIVIKFYSWASKQVVAQTSIESEADVALKLDPRGTHAIFNPTKRDIGIIDLQELLRERGL